GVVDVDPGGAILAPRASRHPAAQLVDEQLHPVADAEQGHTGGEDRGIAQGGVRLVDAARATGEYQGLWPAGLDHGPGRGPWDQLGIDAGLADPAGNQLAVLRSEVEHQHQLLRGCRRRCNGLPLDYLPIPTRCACWSSLPSFCIAAAITISVSWHSLRARA